MAFADDMKRHVINVDRRFDRFFDAIVIESQAAIQFGSAVTGSPGQPVDTGNLRNSWGTERPQPRLAEISTPVEYAPAVEDGVGPHGRVTYGKSGVGGSHSVKQLVANFDHLAEAVAREVIP